jgi:hypothetical protein
MFKRLMVTLTISSLLGMLVQPGLALGKTKAEQEADRAAKTKAKVMQMGVGEKARVSVGLKGKTGEVKGFIRDAGEESFTVADLKTQQTTVIFYKDVLYVGGKGMSTLAKVGIAAGVVAGGMFILYAIWFAQGGE